MLGLQPGLPYLEGYEAKRKMISQLLPGFRDFRTPLVVGSLWLILIWLTFGMPIPDKESKTGIMGLVNSLGNYFPAAALAAVVSFMAYVVGITLVLDSRSVNWMVEKVNSLRIRRLINRQINQDISVRRIDRFDVAQSRKKMMSSRQMIKLVNDNMDLVYGQESKSAFDTDRLMSELIRGIDGEVPLLGSKLLEKNKELYEIFDRLRSEADFRFGISLPLLLISVERSIVFFASGELITSIAVLVLGVLTFMFLVARGWNKLKESTETVLSMVNIGVIRSDVIDNLRFAIESKSEGI